MVRNGKLNESQVWFNDMLHRTVILFENSKNLDLVALKFIHADCKPHLIKINHFSMSKMVWLHNEFSLFNFNNFYNCTFRILNTISISNEEYDLISVQEHESPHLKINIASIFLSLYDNVVIYPLFELDLSLLVSAGEEYTPFEKLFLPFDYGTWIALGVKFSIGICTILIIKCFGARCQVFVFGSKVQTPIFNLLVAFFAQSQQIQPSTNFARYVLMMYILFSMIIRTGYQGVQFELICKV